MLEQPDLFTSIDPREAAYNERMAAQTAQNTEEMQCLAWVVRGAKVDPRHWKDWWDHKPRYERERILRDFRYQRER